MSCWMKNIYIWLHYVACLFGFSPFSFSSVSLSDSLFSSVTENKREEKKRDL